MGKFGFLLGLRNGSADRRAALTGRVPGRGTVGSQGPYCDNAAEMGSHVGHLLALGQMSWRKRLEEETAEEGWVRARLIVSCAEDVSRTAEGGICKCLGSRSEDSERGLLAFLY